MLTEKIGSLDDVKALSPCRLAMGTIEDDGQHTVSILDGRASTEQDAAKSIAAIELIPAPPSVSGVVVVAIRQSVYMTVIQKMRPGDRTDISWLAAATAAAAQRRLWPRTAD
jgi:hypothetical protein